MDGLPPPRPDLAPAVDASSVAPAVDAAGLAKSFGGTLALRDVSFTLQPGEVVGLLGRNGAGKTTTLRIVTGYLAPTEGSVRVAGHDVLEDPIAAKRRLGYLPERPPVHGEMTVRSFLAFCARLRGVERARVPERVEHAMVRCGLAAVRGRIIGNLSRGYQQRVGLAQALVHDPEVLVLDEPTAALDPGQIVEIRQLVRDLSQEVREAGRRTIVLSTHRLEDVAATCARALILSRGRLVADERLDGSMRADALERRFLELTQAEEEAA